MYGSTSKPWGSSNIWGNGSLSNGFSSRVSTRESSRSRDNRQSDDVEGKSGSKQLLEGTSALKDSWSFRPQQGAQQPPVPNRSFSQTRYADKSTSQQRSFSTASISQPLSGASQNPTPLQSSKPPTINLNQTSANQPRIGLNSGFNGSFTGRTYEQPPAVYTKFDRAERASDPTLKKPDSAIGSWAEPMDLPSPTDERRPQYGSGFSLRTAPSSRDPSWPPSRNSDEQPIFPGGHYAQSGHGITPSSSRAPSISSQRNGAYGSLQSDPLSSHFSQMSMSSNSRPSTSYRPGMPANGVSGLSTTVGAMPSLMRSSTHPATNGVKGCDDVEEIERPGMRYFDINEFVPGQQNLTFGEFGPQPFNNRSVKNSSTLDFRNAQPFTPQNMSSRGFDPPNGPRSPIDWQNFTPAATPLNRRSPNVPDSGYLDPRMQQLIQLRNTYTAQLYSPYALGNGMALPPMPPYMGLVPFHMNGVDMSAMATDPPAGDGVQSALMYEFKSNAKSRRYDIKDIYDHIAEFSGDQHGSRFIQTKLETANSDEKERVFREIEPNAIPLMTDVFGNYVIQKFFEHGDQTHKKILANKMRGQVLKLSLQMYGCRVVQKALEHVLVDQQAILVGELREHVIQCVKDQNGNHVIQKAIERCPPDSIDFIVAAFGNQVHQLSVHPYGCRVIQRCLERCEAPAKDAIMAELMDGFPTMIPDQYGNYVVQHVVSKDDGFGRNRVLSIVLGQLEHFSKHKFASNVVEKCIEQSDDRWRRQVVVTLANSNERRTDGEGVLVSMIKDNFGNYVIRKSLVRNTIRWNEEHADTIDLEKLLDTLCTVDFKDFMEILQPAITQAKRTGCGKQMLSIEKKLHSRVLAVQYRGYNHNQPYQMSLNPPSFASPYAATPPPDVPGDAVEGADRLRRSSAYEM